ncbi:MAG: hypothetical protein KJ000_24090 [Pirellulaceae bacterium]|nr:hypothetical protein [Pirellulaceae bacterium]
MIIPDEHAKAIADFPQVLRNLIEAELAAGNRIIELGSGFPAPPVGACLKLAQRVSTRPRASSGELQFFERNRSDYSGEFTDAKRYFFVLEPPLPPPTEPDMDAIRAEREARQHAADAGLPVSARSSASLVDRFRASMIMDHERWREGVGYDLELVTAATPEERVTIEQLLLDGGIRGWRDVEALAALDTPRAREALRAALHGPNPEVRSAVLRYAPDLVTDQERIAALVQSLRDAEFYGGLSQTLDHVAVFHPPEVVEALLRGVLERAGEVAVHFAAMLAFIHGQAAEPFDMDQRPFFLRFNTDDRAERESAFRELCARLGTGETIPM